MPPRLIVGLAAIFVSAMVPAANAAYINYEIACCNRTSDGSSISNLASLYIQGDDATNKASLFVGNFSPSEYITNAYFDLDRVLSHAR